MSNYVAIAIAILLTVLIGVNVFTGSGSNTVRGAINTLMSNTTQSINAISVE